MNRRLLKPVLIIILSALLTALSVAVTKGYAGNLNNAIYMMVSGARNGALTFFMRTFSNIGEWYTYIPAAVVLIVLKKTRFKAGIPLLLTIAVSAILNLAIKHILKVPRPDYVRLADVSGYGFPSAHVMNGFVFAGMCAYLYFASCARSTNGKYKIPAVIAVSVYVLVMAFSRMYLGVHTFTDTLGGMLFGGIILILASGVYEKVFKPS